MFDKWLNLPAHYYLRITAFTILMVGIAVSNVLMSIGAIWILSNWIIEGKFKDYGQRFRKNPLAWAFLGFFLFSLLSLLWSQDVHYGVKDLRVKLPFIVIPLVMAVSKPIDNRVFYYLLYVFLGIVVFTSGWNYIWYNFFCEDPNDIRKMSLFISHVRFSTIVDVGIFTGIFLIMKRKVNRFIIVAVIGWLLFYTFKSQILNGYVLLAVLSLFTVYYLIKNINAKKWRIGLGAGLFLVLAWSIWLISSGLNNYRDNHQINFSQLETFTVNGNRYYHDTANFQRENGYPVWIYLSVKELKKEWNERSEIHYDSLDRKGQPMFGTLMRFMTSKNLRKDSVGVAQLSNDEVNLIENGHTSVNMNTSGIKEKFNAFLEEYYTYTSGGDPNGHSLLQRLEHIRIAMEIIRDNWLTGVGVGDVNRSFDEQYARSQTKLLPENQHRSHNQFLTTWISHGILGIFLFVSILIFPISAKKKKDYFLSVVIIALFVSCLFQDMLETQAGATIFGLFYAVAVFREED